MDGTNLRAARLQYVRRQDVVHGAALCSEGKTPMTDVIRACVHCAHARTDSKDRVVCAALLDKFDLVQGVQPYLNAYAARAPKAACGPNGKLWQELSAAIVIEAVLEEAREPMLTRAGFALAGFGAAAGMAAMAPVHRVGEALAGFKARCAAAYAGWHTVRDNARPLELTADPVEEAKVIQLGGPAIEGPAAIELQAETVAEMVAEPQRLAAPAIEEKAEPSPQAVTGPLALGAIVATLFWLAFGILAHMQQADGQIDSHWLYKSGLLARDMPCCWDVPRGVPCVRCRDARCAPRTFKPRTQFYT